MRYTCLIEEEEGGGGVDLDELYLSGRYDWQVVLFRKVEVCYRGTGWHLKNTFYKTHHVHISC